MEEYDDGPNGAIIALSVLTLMHIVTGNVTGYFTSDGPPTVLLSCYIGLFFSQTSLLGIWSGLATLHWIIRLFGLILGTVYLTLQFSFSLEEWDFEIVVLVTLSVFAVAAVMWSVRFLIGPLSTREAVSVTPQSEGLQFSILHLFIFTFVIGCLLGIGRGLQPLFSGAGDMTLILTLSICFVSIGISSVWATLGSGNWLLRGVVVILISLFATFLPVYFLGRSPVAFWILTMFVAAISLLISLWIVRLCGLRLVRSLIQIEA